MGLLNRKTEKVSTPVLEAGLHNVKVLEILETNDKISEIGSSVEEDKEGWKDATLQIAIKFGSTEGKGVFTHRYSIAGFKRFSELTEKEQKLCDVAGEQEYAVSKKTGMRIIDQERVNKAWESIDKLCANSGLPAGSEVAELAGREVAIMIGENDHGRLVVKYSRKVSTAVAEEVEDDVL